MVALQQARTVTDEPVGADPGPASVRGGSFIPSLVTPGVDWVSFRVPTQAPGARPKPVAVPGLEKAPEGEDPPAPLGPTETIGPFKVLSVGNRLGDAEVMRSAKIPQLQENVLTIRVSKKVAGEVEKAEKLSSRLQAVNFRQVEIVLHSKKDKK